MIGAHDLAGRLGLRKNRRDWRGDCPACAYRSSFIVRQGKHGGALVRCVSCGDQAAIADALGRVTSGEWIKPEQQGQQTDAEALARKIERARVTWAGATAVLGTPAERYLWNRCLGFLTASRRLRYRDDVSHPQGGRHAAMVALVTDAEDKPIAVHRTYLSRSAGQKADMEPSKASLGPVWGGAIRLATWKPYLPLVIGEGIETAASAGLIEDAPAWAAISAGNMAAGLVLPVEVRWVIVAADPDEAGERAAASAADRWRHEGRRVEIIRPPGAGDFNDVLRREGGNG